MSDGGSDQGTPYDPSRVMLNGAAIGLVTALTAGMEQRLMDELRASEKRLSGQLTVLTGDIDTLEAWREAQEKAKERRAGQWSVLHAIGSFLSRHGAVLLAGAIAALTAVVALLGGVQVTFGS